MEVTEVQVEEVMRKEGETEKDLGTVEEETITVDEAGTNVKLKDPKNIIKLRYTNAKRIHFVKL